MNPGLSQRCSLPLVRPAGPCFACERRDDGYPLLGTDPSGRGVGPQRFHGAATLPIPVPFSP